MSNKKNKYLQIFITILNIIGIICLIYFAIPFINHDMTISNPNAMLASYSWDSCGFVLTIGLIPLIVANILAFIFIDLKKTLKILFFIPSLICLVLVSIYLFISYTDEEDSYEPITVGAMKCVLNGHIYHYKVYQEQDGTYSVGIDENDKIPLSIINYSSPETIFNSIEKYYNEQNEMCT